MGNRTNKTLIGMALVALLAGACVADHESVAQTPKGTWVCTASWTSVSPAGVSTPCASEEHITCVDGVLTSTGLLSIGTARWSDTKKGTCYAKAQELYGAWTSVKTTTTNDAARHFERERLEGRSLGDAVSDEPIAYRTQVFFKTDTQIKAISQEGRLVECRRP